MAISMAKWRKKMKTKNHEAINMAASERKYRNGEKLIMAIG